jgi:inorganic pyrophosphatase
MNLHRIAAGTDVPNDCSVIVAISDLPEFQTREIAHLFERYKDVEPGKWIRVEKWLGGEEARRQIEDSAVRYQAENAKTSV